MFGFFFCQRISCLVVVFWAAIEELMPDDGLKTAETCRLVNYMLVLRVTVLLRSIY